MSRIARIGRVLSRIWGRSASRIDAEADMASHEAQLDTDHPFLPAGAIMENDPFRQDSLMMPMGDSPRSAGMSYASTCCPIGGCKTGFAFSPDGVDGEKQIPSSFHGEPRSRIPRSRSPEDSADLTL